MDYLYDNTIFSSKRNAVQYVGEKCNVKLRRALSESSLLPVDEDVCLLYHVSRYNEYLIRPLGIFSDFILDDLCVLPENGTKGCITVFDGLIVDRAKYLKNREAIRKCIELFFKKECNFYYKSNRRPKGIFKLLDYAVAVNIENCEFSDDSSGVSLSFKCLYVKDREIKVAVIKFVLDFSDFSWFCKDGYFCVDKYGYDIKDKSCDCQELKFEYRGDLRERDVCEWAEYINSNYKFDMVIEISDLYRCDRSFCGDVLLECKEYCKYICEEEEKNIQQVTADMLGKSVECFDSADLVVYSYNGKKSKYLDVHMEKGEKFEVGKYYVYQDKMGFVVVNKNSAVVYGLIEPIVDVSGQTVLYGLRTVRTRTEDNFGLSKYYTCVTESLSVLQNAISELDGKVYAEHNYLKDLVSNSKYYRYAGLVGIRDCKFSTLFRFDNAIYSFIRYNGTIKLLFSRVKTAEEKKQLVQNIKKVISVPAIRKLCVKRVYVYNVFEAKSRMNANLNLGIKCVGNYTDFDKLLEMSKKDGLILSISCINKETNKVESSLVVDGGVIVSIDDISIEC